MSTTTPDRPDLTSRLYRTRWFMPAFSLCLGVMSFGAYAIGDEPGIGASGFGVMAVLAAIFFTVIIGDWLVDVAPGGDGSPYAQLGAFAGLASVLAVALLRWRA